MDIGEIRGGFESSLARYLSVVTAAVVAPGLLLAGAIGGWKALLGAFIGFGLAGVNSFVVLKVLRWSLGKTPQALPSILMVSYMGRLVLLAGILYGLRFIKALDMIAVLVSLLALYIAHTAVEMYIARKVFGSVLKSGGRGKE